MPKLGRKTPCAECPWLRKSTAGYLGHDNPVHFYRVSVAQEQHMPCHMTIDYDGDPNWMENQLPDADLCAGNLIYYKNFCKLPRNGDLAAAVGAVQASPHVFGRPEEFMAHHVLDATPETAAELAKRASWPYAADEEDLD